MLKCPIFIQAKIEMFYKQLADARDTYRAFLKSLDDAAKLEKGKKAKMQMDAQKVTIFA